MQIFSPAIIMVGAFSAVVGYSVPDIQRALNPPPVTVRSLSLLDDRCPWQGIGFYGRVIQERNVHDDGVFFYVVCDPAVLLDKSCSPVPGCAGNSCACELLRATYGDTTFRLPATWYWRSDQSTQLSQDFVQAE